MAQMSRHVEVTATEGVQASVNRNWHIILCHVLLAEIQTSPMLSGLFLECAQEIEATRHQPADKSDQVS